MPPGDEGPAGKPRGAFCCPDAPAATLHGNPIADAGHSLAPAAMGRFLVPDREIPHHPSFGTTFVTAIATTRLALALTGIALCLMPTTGSASDQTGRIAQVVDQAFRPLLRQYDVPGIAVAVTVGGRQHVFGFGIASRETRQPVTSDTLFEIGSVSKAFTATLATYAEAQGKLSLADRPGRFVRALEGSAINRASLLHLGTYTAGGPPLQFPGTVRNATTMTDYFRSWRPDAAPGAQRRYSNPSIGLMGHAAARAMGRSFPDLMEREIFPRLGLQRTYIRVPPAEMARYAMGYGRTNQPARVSPAALADEAYGVKTSATDLIRFVEANLRPGALDPAMRRAVEGTQVGHFRVGAMVQGLGWEQYPWPVALERLLAGNAATMAMDPHPAVALVPPVPPAGPTLFNKTGSTNGFGAYVAFVPAKNIGIVMLANRNVPIPARIAAAHAVLEALAAEAP
jgi:beta-lactamase class C